MGSLESWLLLRSIRTFHLRIVHQSATATALVEWLVSLASTPKGSSFEGVPGGVLTKGICYRLFLIIYWRDGTVFHSSLQEVDSRGFHPSQQMQGGWSATFAILLSTSEYAKALPHLTNYLVVSPKPKHCVYRVLNCLSSRQQAWGVLSRSSSIEQGLTRMRILRWLELA